MNQQPLYRIETEEQRDQRISNRLLRLAVAIVAVAGIIVAVMW